jgi:hypothetical protein
VLDSLTHTPLDYVNVHTPHVASVASTRWEELHRCSADKSDSHRIRRNVQVSGDAIAKFTKDSNDLYERLIRSEAILRAGLQDLDARIARLGEGHPHSVDLVVTRAQRESMLHLLDSVTDHLASPKAGPDTTDGTLG